MSTNACNDIDYIFYPPCPSKDPAGRALECVGRFIIFDHTYAKIQGKDEFS